MDKILVLNGPNLNLLGKREPGVYGDNSLASLTDRLVKYGQTIDTELIFIQSNHEGELIDALHSAEEQGIKGAVFNPGAFTHYSYALRDAVAAIGIPVVEIHISNIQAREEFRKTSVIAPVAAGQISGFGLLGYELALQAVHEYIRGRERDEKDRKNS